MKENNIELIYDSFRRYGIVIDKDDIDMLSEHTMTKFYYKNDILLQLSSNVWFLNKKLIIYNYIKYVVKIEQSIV